MVEQSNSSLHAIVVELVTEGNRFLPGTLGRALHGQVMEWIANVDAVLAAAIHDSKDTPFTVSPLFGNRAEGKPRAGESFFFRITLLQGFILPIVLQGLEEWEDKSVVLGGHTFHLKAVYCLPGSHRWTGSSDYNLLLALAIPQKEVTLVFHTPTSFKQKDFIQPFPLPDLVFGSLWRKWNSFCPGNCQIDEEAWQVLVSGFELQTRVYRLEGGAEIGCQGWVRYVFTDEKQARLGAVLSHFAFFAGVGRKTTMGMGLTSLREKRYE
ncbi:MAG: CRISPR system precrRNA processing endoribonuclease RAMP protein Cas6 [Pseudanabaenaceae cyanobacterium SKYGB_i_bin29]|nr:CRISPR system precrRNA processing endoribonuclease RAMP protein Cas6 [Pseudanabaenaceae cyanobacterium SKYG29]MDW8420996.1 CRISPR system precrRNA processing endoribonuclease RAMP protein Cas6 [Pseudanabaenaceae cyanobacterium SKYGB_i_bin29]